MNEQFFYGHGKLLLTGEYFVLDGAKSLALPTNLGQKLHVTYRPSNNPVLLWKSFDKENNCWFETKFELWHFNCIIPEQVDLPEVIILQNILRQARKQNIHFLRDECDVIVNTSLEFNREWGLGSSSTLVYNIAQWAYISPYELLSKTFGGSGYDIACAQSMGPITYQIKSRGPHWETVNFGKNLQNLVYFVYLNNKQNSREGIKRYIELKQNIDTDKIISEINQITDSIIDCNDYQELNNLIFTHENIISMALDLPRVYDVRFNDYWGSIKSLGAWGGDFIMVTSDRTRKETENYFSKYGYNTIFSYDELILHNFEKFSQVNNVMASGYVNEFGTNTI